ncbi:glycosyltransferase family 4 protein [Bradyrhizobium septentrionale]|nr:glycosyltransferase family 4 protein [Bradyrhizobium septentrionale]UGY15881.1 glycosyltransferase family 4 protein [Bradyrhizobium septentrionale]
MSFPTAAISYLPEAYSLGDKRIMGRQAAGAGFLKALAREKPERLFCYTPKREFVDQFATDIRRSGSDTTTIEWLPPPAHRRLGEPGLLYLPDPGLAPYAWRRARHSPRAYSLCGITHTTMTHVAMGMLSSMPLSPLEHWDAVICTSLAVHKSVDQLLKAQAAFLKARLGARRMPIPQLPVIPLGVNCADFTFREGERQRARQMLGIDDDEIVLLYVGRLSFHAKAHHVPMLLAAEQASKGHKVVLVLAGWFSRDATEELYVRECAQFGPSLRRIFVDGRKAKDLKAAWAAADIFTSLADNFQETFGLTPVEAMASGLPVVVSDWNGYKETIRHGTDGFRVPTLTLPPGSAEFLVERADFGFDNYDTYTALTSQLIAVDIPAAATAYSTLFANPDLRRQMGAAGQKRARDHYDWSQIMKLYAQLWTELGARRRSKVEGTVPAGAIRPDRLNPFSMFNSYPTRTLDGACVFALGEGVDRKEVQRRLSAESIARAAQVVARPQVVDEIVGAFEKHGPSLSMSDLIRHMPNVPGESVERTVMVLTKCGILTLQSKPKATPSARKP